MNKENTRSMRIERLKNTQAARQESARNRVYEAIDNIQKVGGTINFHVVARAANVSVSYLYKYPDIKQYIASIRHQQSQIHQRTLQHPTSSDSDAQIVNRLKQRLLQLEKDNQELKRQNQALAGQVYRIHNLQEQLVNQQKIISDLQTQAKPAQTHNSAVNVTPLPQNKTDSHRHNYQNTSSCNLTYSDCIINEQIQTELQAIGVSLNSTLSRKIQSKPTEIVFRAIEALKQAIENGTHIRSPGGWLSEAIDSEWEKNQSICNDKNLQDASEKSVLDSEFQEWYQLAISKKYVLDVPINYLSKDRYDEPIVKVNQPGNFGAHYTETPWRKAKADMDLLFSQT